MSQDQGNIHTVLKFNIFSFAPHILFLIQLTHSKPVFLGSLAMITSTSFVSFAFILQILQSKWLGFCGTCTCNDFYSLSKSYEYQITLGYFYNRYMVNIWMISIYLSWFNRNSSLKDQIRYPKSLYQIPQIPTNYSNMIKITLRLDRC